MDSDASPGIHSDVLLSIGRLISVSERFSSLCGFDDAANGIHNDQGVSRLAIKFSCVAP
jgi:hypothetical protein